MNIFPSTILPNRTQIPWADSAWVYASVFLSHVRNESGKNCPSTVGPTWQGHWPILTCCISKGVSMCFSINTSFYIKKKYITSPKLNTKPAPTEQILPLILYREFLHNCTEDKIYPLKKIGDRLFPFVWNTQHTRNIKGNSKVLSWIGVKKSDIQEPHAQAQMSADNSNPPSCIYCFAWYAFTALKKPVWKQSHQPCLTLL